MQKQFSFLAAAVLLVTSSAFASNVGVDLNVHIGTPPPSQVVVREQPPPPPPSRDFIVEDDIDFLYPSALGFYVAVGVPYDLFYISNKYFMFRGGQWYKGTHHRGPWTSVQYKQLPPGLRKHKLEKVHYHRDHEYGKYERERDHYRGKHFRSGKEGRKEHKKEDKHDRKEEKRHDKQERKEHKGGHGND